MIPADPRARRAPFHLRLQRRWLIVAAILLLAGLAVGGAVAWHYSSRVLVLDRSGWPQDATVEGLGHGRILLSRSDDTVRPGVYGLLWQGGHAIVGEVLGGGGETVTRRLRAVHGLYLRPGMKVAVDPDVYAGDPRESLGLPFEVVRYPDETGPMPAWLIPGRSSTWAIVVHG